MYKILSLVTIEKDAKVLCFEKAHAEIREKIKSIDFSDKL